MDGRSVAPSDISKEPALLSQSQEDISKLDVLVCGICHEVFHFVKEFEDHKSEGCSGVSHLRSLCENESKPQVWGFILWKNKELALNKYSEITPSSWTIYQQWCKLSQLEREAWITAGQTIQFFTKIGTAKLNEFKLKSTKPEEKDPLAIDGLLDLNRTGNALTTSESKTLVGSANLMDIGANTTDLIKQGIIKPVNLNSDVTILPSTKNGECNKAYRTNKENYKQEYAVEKIMAKRFNPKRKTFEYQVKWENFSSDANTWEPISHLKSCKALVDEFEENLRRLRALKTKDTIGTPKSRSKPRRDQTPLKQISTENDSNMSPGRPQRSCKQKALTQVKEWCGDISDAEDVNVKRSREDDSDSDSSYEKKLKLEDSDDSDSQKKSVPSVKKVTKPTVNIVNNGFGGQKLPQNILIPDANGIVRINQKQLPSLSTGVYIMSKTAGIIKLDTAASKVATSGGQTIVKVAPKIGQTQIRIVKKDSGGVEKTIHEKTVPMSPKVPTPKIQKATPAKAKTEVEKVIKAPEVKIESKPPPVVEEDSDDGLEELAFPTDLPLPEPESPPGDFVLDPITGKIAGQEYPEPVEEPEQKETDLETETNPAPQNIVDLAAADLTEEDLKSDLGPGETLTAVTVEENSNTMENNEIDDFIKAPIEEPVVNMDSCEPVINKIEPTPNPKIQKKVPIIVKKDPPKVLNHSFASESTIVNPLIRISPKKPFMSSPKPKFNISLNTTRYSSNSNRMTYSKSNITRKIGNTTIYKSTTNYREQVQHKPQSKKPKNSPSRPIVFETKQIIEKPKPKPVIDMPSLIPQDEEEFQLDIKEPTTDAAATTTATSSNDLINENEESFPINEAENPLFITGDDGTIYQVAGQNEHGQTILITQGSDGQQQCLLVTNDSPQETISPETSIPEVAAVPEEPEPVRPEEEMIDQVVAQVVRAEPPSPGGTHKVVVMLPDGNLMVTQVTPEEYASLELE